MKKFSLCHHDKIIQLLGPFKHLRISIDYDRVDHHAVHSEAYWLMRFLNKHWDFALNSVQSQVLPATRPSNRPAKVVPPLSPAQVPPQNHLDPETYKKLLNRLATDLRDRLPQPSTKLRHSNQVRRELGISHTTLWRWRKQGLLRTVKICNSVYVDVDSLAEFESRARKGEFAKQPRGAAATFRHRAVEGE
jgi:hypothetical protein